MRKQCQLTLLALTDVVKVSWRESLWQMAGEDEAGEEGKAGVLVVDQDRSLRAALRRAQVELQQHRGAHARERGERDVSKGGSAIP